MNLKSNFIFANSKYVKHKKNSSFNKSNNGNINQNQNSNKNKSHLEPLIHFTNLSSKKLKILGYRSKPKTEQKKSDI